MNGTVASISAPGPRLGFACIRVADIGRSLSFYGDLLGMQQRRRLQPGPNLTEVLLDGGDATQPGVVLMHDASRQTAYSIGDGFSRLILYVHNLPALEQRLRAAQIEIMREPTRVEVLDILIMLVRDPDGYVLELIERR